MINKTIFGALILIGAMNLLAVDIPVPAANEMVASSNSILVIEGVDVKSDRIAEGKVKEVIRGDAELVGKSVQLLSPYPSMSFPFVQWVTDVGDKPMIILGLKMAESNTVSLIYGTASIWPKGAPAEVSKNKSLQECKLFIKRSLKEDASKK